MIHATQWYPSWVQWTSMTVEQQEAFTRSLPASERTARAREAVGHAIVRYGDEVRGRMRAMGAKDWSDAEIERCLGPCVCGPFLVKLAREMPEYVPVGKVERAGEAMV